MRSTSTPPISSPARSAAPARWLLAIALGLGAVACGEEVRLEGPDAGCTSSTQCAEGTRCFAAGGGSACDSVLYGSCVPVEGRELPLCGCHFGPVGQLQFPDGQAQYLCGLPAFDAGPDSGVRDLGPRD